MRTIIALAAMLLAGCATNPLPPVPKNADQALYEAKVALDAAVIQVDAYAQLPRCERTNSPVCSYSATAKKLYGLALEANQSIDTARSTLVAVRSAGGDQQKELIATQAALSAVQRLSGAILAARQGVQ
jgi:hypothetical protein